MCIIQKHDVIIRNTTSYISHTASYFKTPLRNYYFWAHLYDDSLQTRQHKTTGAFHCSRRASTGMGGARITRRILSFACTQMAACRYIHACRACIMHTYIRMCYILTYTRLTHIRTYITCMHDTHTYMHYMHT